MAKNRLIVDYQYDFEIYGIISPAKEYRLAWLLNNHLKIHLVKNEDIVHNFVNREDLRISNYIYETENMTFRLLKNKSENKTDDKLDFLIPELHKFDFFIMKNGLLDGKADSGFLSAIKQIPGIHYITGFDIEKIKSKENLIF